jgi:hypothetical protein
MAQQYMLHAHTGVSYRNSSLKENPSNHTVIQHIVNPTYEGAKCAAEQNNPKYFWPSRKVSRSSSTERYFNEYRNADWIARNERNCASPPKITNKVNTLARSDSKYDALKMRIFFRKNQSVVDILYELVMDWKSPTCSLT